MNRVRRVRRLKSIWLAALILFLVMGIGYTNRPFLNLSPGNQTSNAFGQLVFAGFVVLILLVLLLVLVIPYFMHEFDY